MFTLLSMLHSEPHRTLRDICYVNDTKHFSAKHPHNVKATERNINNGFVVQGAGIRDDFFFLLIQIFPIFLCTILITVSGKRWQIVFTPVTVLALETSWALSEGIVEREEGGGGDPQSCRKRRSSKTSEPEKQRTDATGFSESRKWAASPAVREAKNNLIVAESSEGSASNKSREPGTRGHEWLKWEIGQNL